jgi:DNA-directed RNA polymerase subunit RPC12/RpoP
MIQKLVSYLRQRLCAHKEWEMDTQLRTIRCCSCGLRSWVKPKHKDLYTKGV